MQYNNQAYLSLVWKDPKERKQYLIGRLSKGEEFVFKYDDEIKNALKAGFHPLLAFSNLKQEYHSKLMKQAISNETFMLGGVHHYNKCEEVEGGRAVHGLSFSRHRVLVARCRHRGVYVARS